MAEPRAQSALGHLQVCFLSLFYHSNYASKQGSVILIGSSSVIPSINIVLKGLAEAFKAFHCLDV